MDDFDEIKKGFDVIEAAAEKVGKKKLTTFGRAELNTFIRNVSELRGRAVNLEYETMG